MSIQKNKEAKLKKEMIQTQQACAGCGRFDYFLDKHEIKPRSLGGDPLDPKNCVLLCRPCHFQETNSSNRRQSREEFPYFKEA